jgi:hypothetical protein
MGRSPSSSFDSLQQIHTYDIEQQIISCIGKGMFGSGAEAKRKGERGYLPHCAYHLYAEKTCNGEYHER